MPNAFFRTDFRCDCDRCFFCRSERRKAETAIRSHNLICFSQ
nr:MAG TPA: hypothetical protein [Caudoviricetes sp.]